MKRLLPLILLLVLLCACVKQPTECQTHVDGDQNLLCDQCGQSVVIIVDFYNINDLHGKLADGVEVISRNDSNYFDAAEEITKTICIFAKISEKEVADYRKNAAKMAEKALWKHFIKNYLSAYDFAMQAAAKRTKK